MKFKLLVAGLAVAAATLVIAQETAQPATYVDAAKVAEIFAKAGKLASGPDFSASGTQRTAAGQVEVHEKETDIFLITDGSATFITGGKMIGGKQSKAAQWLGTSIEGGEVHQLKKGDFITIPAGTPHWFKEVPKSINYYMVKVIKP